MSPRTPFRFVALVGMVTLLHGTGCSWIFVTKVPAAAGSFGTAGGVHDLGGLPSDRYRLGGAGGGHGRGVHRVGNHARCALFASRLVLRPGHGSRSHNGPCRDGGVLLASAIPLAISAGYGYAKSADCRQVKETQLACVSGVEPACLTLKERKP